MLAVVTYLVIPSWISGVVLLTFMCILGFANHPLRKGKGKWWIIDAILVLAGIAIAIYVIADIDRLETSGAVFPTKNDLVVFVIGTIVVLELTRRLTGWILPVVAILALAYAFLGQYLPGLWGHPGFPFSRIFGISYSENGIFSVPIRVMVRYIYLL